VKMSMNLFFFVLVVVVALSGGLLFVLGRRSKGSFDSGEPRGAALLAHELS